MDLVDDVLVVFSVDVAVDGAWSIKVTGGLLRRALDEKEEKHGGCECSTKRRTLLHEPLLGRQKIGLLISIRFEGRARPILKLC
eukprot:1186373-Amphidinium_carterae.2